MKTFDFVDGDLDGTRGKWRPALKPSVVDGEGLPSDWKELAVISCPGCGAHFGVGGRGSAAIGADGRTAAPVTCGYSRPPVTRLERKIFDRRGRLIRTDIREAAPAFACSFSDVVELAGWSTTAGLAGKAAFVNAKLAAVSEVEAEKDARLAAKIKAEHEAELPKKIADAVKARRSAK